MTILVKNKHTLQIDEFKFRCCIGKNGSTKSKKEGDKKTPKGAFEIENLYWVTFLCYYQSFPSLSYFYLKSYRSIMLKY